MERKNSFDAFLTRRMDELRKAIAALEQEGRDDEANLNKVRLNIVNVFFTVAAADAKAVGHQGWEAFCQRFQPRFAGLSSPWRARLEKARLHQDACAIAVEEAKIEMAEQIKKVFLQWRE